MRRLLFIAIISAIIIPCSLFSSCSDSDEEGDVAEQVELYNYWQLIGFASATNFHYIDEEYRMKDETYGYRFYLFFEKEGRFGGRDAINGFGGTYSCKGHNIKIENIVSTAIYSSQGYEESEAFIDHLRNATSFDIADGNKLRLYYSKNEYLYFEAMER